MTEITKRYYDPRTGSIIAGEKPLSTESPNLKNLHQTTTNYGKKTGEPHICDGCLKPIEIGKPLYSLHITKEPREGLILHFNKRFHDKTCFEVWDKNDGII